MHSKATVHEGTNSFVHLIDLVHVRHCMRTMEPLAIAGCKAALRHTTTTPCECHRRLAGEEFIASLV